MISFDTNLLLYSLNRDCAEYDDARAFFTALPIAPGAMAICELVLVELLWPTAAISHATCALVETSR